MTGRERILTALSGGIPDTVPTFTLAMNEGSILNIGRHFTDDLPAPGYAGQMAFEDQLKILEALALIHEELDVDAVTAFVLDTPGEAVSETRYRNEWGVVMERNPHGQAVPVGHPIATPADLASYTRPSLEPQNFIIPQLVQPKVAGRRALIVGVFGPFTFAWELRGLQHLMVDFLRHPDVAHALMRHTTDYNLDVVDAAAEVGADAVAIADDIADKHNPFFSPAHFGTFLDPYLRELVARAHGHGLKLIFHSDGNLWPVLDQLIATGIDGLHPLEPEAGMDLARLKQTYGARVCLMGNIDCGALLCHGTTAEVEAAVRQAIDAGAPHGGYILADSNTIHPGVNPENYIAMMRETKRYGVYAEGAAA